MVSARPDSPGPAVSVTIIFIGEATLMANSTATNPSQPRIAVRRWVALHRAILAARLGWLPRSGAESAATPGSSTAYSGGSGRVVVVSDISFTVTSRCG